MYKKSIQKGSILLALPSASTVDYIFSRSVILITEYKMDSIVGFILNKPLDIQINSLVSEINANFTVYYGGPVEQDKLFYIHKKPLIIPGSIHIIGDIYWGGDYESLIHLINTNQIQKDELRFFLGYSGWNLEQLNNEITDSQWIYLDNEIDHKKIFLSPSRTLWKTYIQEQGEEYSIWSNAPEDPNLN